MNRPAQNTQSPKTTRSARSLPKLACAALLLAAASSTRAQDIAVYGGESGLNEVTTYTQAGTAKGTGLFETAIGSGVYSVNDNIEDIACDAWGRLYALGKPGASGLRTVYKSQLTGSLMKILFHTVQNYDASVDGSIAISPTGDVAIYGAHSVSTFGSSLKVFDQKGNALKELLFQTSVGGGSFSVSLNIEDIAYDAAGTLYAIGKAGSGSPRTIFRELNGLMYILFQQNLDYSSTVDGSIAISPTGDIAVYGAQSVQALGTSVQVYNQAGTMLTERLFQNAVGGSSWGVSTSIEDIAYDGAGNLYAVGKPGSLTSRAVFKSGTPGKMDILFVGSGYSSTVDAGMAIRPPTAWTTMFGGALGSAGLPELEGSGTLASGPSNQVRLSHAKPNTPVTMFVGFTALNVPFKGGTLVPEATLVVSLATGSDGTVTLPFVMPVGVPSGLEFYLQCWLPDAAATKGFAGSNGLKGVTP